MSSQRRPSVSQRQETQPVTFKLDVKALWSLPYRLCNPPPAVGKVRSCAVTPVFQVQLEDVLNRKHLPPLGLKDLEEWLLYVEHCPENLYFILWLKEYTAKYNQWALQFGPHKSSTSPSSTSYHITWPNSSSLALFYARAKQTFFTPNRSSPYELNISSDILSPFHTSNFGSPHPDPTVFAEVAIEVQKMLKESLARMVVAAYANMGSSRSMCGIVGGCCLILLGSIAPLIVNFLNGRDRWLRLLALPGIWLGLTFVLTSLHGVCIILYIFGDLRQLRKFELSRPPISRPQALLNQHHRPVSSPPLFNPASSSIVQPPILPISQPVRCSISPPPPHINVPPCPQPVVIHEPPCRRSISSSSAGSYTSSASGSASISSSPVSDARNDAALTIEISPAFYDDSHIEGPATGFLSSTRRCNSPSLDSQSSCSVAEFTPTAPFIHPYDPLGDNDGTRGLSPEDRQGIETFDFDLLPKRGHTPPQLDQAVSVATNDPMDAPPIAEKDSKDTIAGLRSLKDLLRLVQRKCNKRNLMTDPEKLSPPSLFPPRPVDPAVQFKVINCPSSRLSAHAHPQPCGNSCAVGNCGAECGCRWGDLLDHRRMLVGHSCWPIGFFARHLMSCHVTM